MLGVVAIRFFKTSSEEEREHAEKFMKYQAFFSLICSLFTLNPHHKGVVFLIYCFGLKFI